jgi:hypothetical protein
VALSFQECSRRKLLTLEHRIQCCKEEITFLHNQNAGLKEQLKMKKYSGCKQTGSMEEEIKTEKGSNYKLITNLEEQLDMERICIYNKLTIFS